MMEETNAHCPRTLQRKAIRHGPNDFTSCVTWAGILREQRDIQFKTKSVLELAGLQMNGWRRDHAYEGAHLRVTGCPGLCAEPLNLSIALRQPRTSVQSQVSATFSLTFSAVFTLLAVYQSLSTSGIAPTKRPKLTF